MSNERLGLYDFIVDVVPGLLALGLVVLLLPAHPFVQGIAQYGNLASGFFALAGGYVVGRLLHAIGGWLIDPFRRFASRPISVEDRVHAILAAENDDSLEHRVTEAVVSDLESKFSLERSNITDQLPELGNRGTPGDTHDLVFTRYLADSMLYDRGNLSWKYLLLATFFRNSLLVFGLFGLLFIIRPFTTGNPTLAEIGYQPWNLSSDVGFGLVLLVAFATCISLWLTFERRRARATINELFLQLDDLPGVEEEPEWLVGPP